ncbi:DUF5937 family protein [Catellatospora sp. NPDC049609]|uniref:ArsR/SmtB family transcription factor n=1 Tax=Catellatospora sp. NPDC049609 TaxID=3155505 RepID=UPI00342B41BB
MATVIRMGGPEMARVRFALSPLYETVMALDTLLRPGVHAVHLPWAARMKWALEEVPHLRLLTDLLHDDAVKPSFLMPPPDSRLPDLEHELRRVAATPSARVRADIAELHRARLGPLRQLADDPRSGLRAVVEALRACHEALVAPYWTRIRRVLEADIVHRASRLAESGVEGLFTSLHDEVRWADGVLAVHHRRPPLDPEPLTLRGHGLVLCPSVFCWPRVAVGTRPVGDGTLRYPARGVAALWHEPEPAPAALAGLLGRTRAALLVALARPATTGDLAGRLEITPAAVSQHLNVLRAAGLVATQRDSRVVLHLRTERGDGLVA